MGQTLVPATVVQNCISSLNAQAVVLIGCAKRSASLPSYGTCLVAIAVLFALKTLHVLANVVKSSVEPITL